MRWTNSAWIHGSGRVLDTAVRGGKRPAHSGLRVHGLLRRCHVLAVFLALGVAASVPGVRSGDGSGELSAGRRRVGTEHTRHRRSDPDALNCNVTMEPDSVRVVESQTHLTNFTVTCSLQTSEANFTLSVRIEDTEVARIHGKDRFTGSVIISPTDGSTILVFLDQLEVKGQSFGRTLMETRVEPEPDEDDILLPSYAVTSEVVVLKENSIINVIYLAIVGLMIVIYNFAFGCKIEWSLIVAILKKPVAPAIGFCCQFLVMAPVGEGEICYFYYLFIHSVLSL